MKPLKLTMTAFGPYKNSEIIDFKELGENHIYVISGNTGAGKTTVFDGICFALYGSASGEDRENDAMLRSDFATDDTHTSVELEFELKGKIYRILRQLGHVKQGNKSKTGDKYEFFEYTEGREIPCVDRQIVSEINEKVESLMGLTENQFKQIVMLPQGEFRKLLTSETENKEEILRRLFKTDDYKQMGERLGQKKTIAAETLKQVTGSRDTYINYIQATLPYRDESEVFQVLEEGNYNTNQILAGLEKEIDFYDEKITTDKTTYEDMKRKHQEEQAAFHEAKALNDRFADLQQKEEKFAELTEATPKIKQIESELENAERASKIEPEEERVKEIREDQQVKQQHFTTAKTEHQTSNEQLLQAKQQYDKEEKRKDERETLRKELERLNQFYPTVEKIDQDKRQLTDLKNIVKQHFKDYEVLKKQLKQLEETEETNRKRIDVLDKADSKRLAMHQELKEMRNQVKMIMAYKDAKKEEAKSQEDLQQKEKKFVQAKEKYNQLEATWLNNQAVVLASHLHEGKACPVCGSIDHPDKATQESGDITRDKLNEYKKMLEIKEKEYQETSSNHSGKVVRMHDREKDLKELTIALEDVESEKHKLSEQGKQLKENVTQLDADKQKLDELKQENHKISDQLKSFKQDIETKEQAYHNKNQELTGGIAAYKERIKPIPDELQDLNVLKRKIDEVAIQAKQLEAQWETAQKKIQTAREDATKKETNLSHSEKLLKEVQTKSAKAEERFKEALEKSGFASEVDYQQAKRDAQTQAQFKDEINQFNQNLATTKEQINELKNVLKDKSKADIVEFEANVTRLDEASQEALKQLNQARDYYKQAETLQEHITESNAKLKESEREYHLIADLHDMIRGNNDKKISFERFLQIDYLEQIIEAANHRLNHLSNGQYSLLRSDRQESHGKQSGLGLDVYDEYTGQMRDVKSLSGGEKFNASLCLALGMSDVIQSFQGNIQIDTMFIDEGFGTLDEEALNKAIDTLIELQESGRMIGVISHVKELRTIFPAVLEVRKTKEGYSETKFIVK